MLPEGDWKPPRAASPAAAGGGERRAAISATRRAGASRDPNRGRRRAAVRSRARRRRTARAGRGAAGPRHPGTGPARRLPWDAAAHGAGAAGSAGGHVRPGELRVLQEDEGAREAGGAPQGGVNGDGALLARVEEENMCSAVCAARRTERVFVQGCLQDSAKSPAKSGSTERRARAASRRGSPPAAGGRSSSPGPASQPSAAQVLERLGGLDALGDDVEAEVVGRGRSVERDDRRVAPGLRPCPATNERSILISSTAAGAGSTSEE